MPTINDDIARINSIPFPTRTVWDKDRFPQYDNPQPFKPFMQQGWECPKCGHVYAPTVTECKHCSHDESATTTGDTTAYVLTEKDGKLAVRKFDLED